MTSVEGVGVGREMLGVAVKVVGANDTDGCGVNVVGIEVDGLEVIGANDGFIVMVAIGAELGRSVALTIGASVGFTEAVEGLGGLGARVGAGNGIGVGIRVGVSVGTKEGKRTCENVGHNHRNRNNRAQFQANLVTFILVF
jgi:hypothetical protein